MNPEAIKVGDTVRKINSSTPFQLAAGPSLTAVVREITYGGYISVEGHTRRRNQYRPDLLEVVVPAPEATPEPAEEGVYIGCSLDAAGNPRDFSVPFKHWVDAENAAQRAAEFFPGTTYGVLKLVGTVSMKPTWS